MRFTINLIPISPNPVLPFNYQYPLAAAIFHTLAGVGNSYAAFLHDTGYSKADSLKKFKLFTFSDLQTPFTFRGDRLFLTGSNARLTIAFTSGMRLKTLLSLFMNQ